MESLRVFVDESFDAKTLAVGPPEQGPVMGQTAAFAFPPGLKPAVYDVYVSIGARDGTPVLALPLADGDGQRRYRLGTLRIDVATEAGSLDPAWSDLEVVSKPPWSGFHQRAQDARRDPG